MLTLRGLRRRGYTPEAIRAFCERIGVAKFNSTIDMAWLGGGILFWWPVILDRPARPRFGYPLKIGYLILATIVNAGTFLYLTFSELPVYATYELAPPVYGISARDDQRVAGLLMKVGTATVLWAAIGILFYLWYRKESDGPLTERRA